MLLILMACFSIDNSDWDVWKDRTTNPAIDLGIPVSLVPAGSFQMGCVDGDDECENNEIPAHSVDITKDFYVMQTEVTQDLYETIMGINPSRYLGSLLPVEQVSWYDAIEFANELSELEEREICYTIDDSIGVPQISWNRACTGWRLLTEAEWEYAAKGNQEFIYAGSDNIDEVGWYQESSNSMTMPVALKTPNAFELYDMSGNVNEWLWDWYYEPIYEEHAQQDVVEDPIGVPDGITRVFRGGGATQETSWLRISSRSGYYPDFTSFGVGIRLAMYK